MSVNLFDPVYLQSIANAVCWTLIHSLWQGLIVAILAGVIILSTKKSRPFSRYTLFVGTLVVFVLVNCVTFCWLFKKELVVSKNQGLIAFDQLPAVIHAPTQPIRIVSDIGLEYLQLFIDWTNHNSVPILAIWLTIFLLKSGRTAAGILCTEKLRNSKSEVVGDFRNRKLHELAAKLGLGKKIGLVESGSVQVPLVGGIYKPLIIVPLGFFTSLPHAQIEAILLHELAHIKRRDYLANLLQCICENIYFFNPGVFWLSSLIREEREHCCDELVVGITRDRRSFATALVSFKQMQLAASDARIAFTGSQNHLLNRIKRVIFNENKQLNTMEKFFVTTSFIAATFISMSYLSPPQNVKSNVVPVKMQTAVLVTPGNPPLEKEDRRVATPTVSRQPNRTHGKENQVDSLKQVDALMAELATALSNNDLEKANALKSNIYRAIWSEKARLRLQNTEMKLRSETFAARKNERTSPDILADLEEKVLQSSQDAMQRRSESLDRIEAEFERVAKDLRSRNREIEVVTEQTTQEQIARELISEGVIKDTENLTYRLHNMFLTVNGVEQPAALHQKLKAKYLKNTWTEWVYNWDGVTAYRFTGVRYGG